jgi:hypothetical protein
MLFADLCIIAVGFMAIRVGLIRAAWAGEGGQGANCKTSDDCKAPFRCRNIEGNKACALAEGPQPVGSMPHPNFKRCHTNADCDPGWTCGGGGVVLPSGGDLMANRER